MKYYLAKQTIINNIPSNDHSSTIIIQELTLLFKCRELTKSEKAPITLVIALLAKWRTINHNPIIVWDGGYSYPS